jgi:cysteinyl-tRNA synthetase
VNTIKLHCYNTLTRQKEAFESIDPGKVRMYTCGPTVYRHPHIGNMRTFLFADLIRRSLEYNGYQVTQVTNITDVGHMADETGLDIQAGEDKMEAASRAERKTPEQIADFYTQVFLDDLAAMNIQPAHHYPKATEHVPHMIDLTQRLVNRGMAYIRDGFVYYAVGKFPDYGRLSGNTLDQLQAGHRSEVDTIKDNPADFTLWRAAGEGRLTVWESPWGPGFPGWHIECSAMSMHYLGEQLDVHTGGEDLAFPHHENEIAQSEGATEEPFVRFWMHGAHLLAEGRKMSKQTGNVILLRDIGDDEGYLSLEAEGIESLAFRLLCFTVHYRHQMNVTWDNLRGQQTTLDRLRRHVHDWMAEGPPANTLSPEAQALADAFRAAVDDDLAMPQALTMVWETTKSDMPVGEKLALILDFDRILGLRLDEIEPTDANAEVELADHERVLIAARAAARAAKDWAEADRLRDELADLGITVADTPEGITVRRMS